MHGGAIAARSQPTPSHDDGGSARGGVAAVPAASSHGPAVGAAAAGGVAATCADSRTRPVLRGACESGEASQLWFCVHKNSVSRADIFPDTCAKSRDCQKQLWSIGS